MSVAVALLGWKRFTAKIIYFMPDHPHVVNPNWLLWQQDDRAPDFPRLNSYLRWWQDNIDGKINGVFVWVEGLIVPTELKVYGQEFRLN